MSEKKTQYVRLTGTGWGEDGELTVVAEVDPSGEAAFVTEPKDLEFYYVNLRNPDSEYGGEVVPAITNRENKHDFREGDTVRLAGEAWGDARGAHGLVRKCQSCHIKQFEIYNSEELDRFIVDSSGLWAAEVVGYEEFAGDPAFSWTGTPNASDSKYDPVNPEHYSFGGVEVIDITRHMDFLTGNAVKYLTRAGRKGERLTDLKKAAKYIQWAIEDEEAGK